MCKDCKCKNLKFSCKPMTDCLSKDDIVNDLNNFKNAFANCTNETFQYMGNVLNFEVTKSNCKCKPEYHDGACHQLDI